MGDIGLPAAFGDVGLPAPAGGGGFGSIDLPSLGAGPGLPAPAYGAAGLPAAVDQGNFLPRAAAPGAHLPASVGRDQHLPAVAGSLPTAVHDSSFLPANAGGGGGDAFGEVDFGDFGAPPAPPPPPQQAVSAGAAGGVGFGELDFGAGGGGDSVGVEGDILGGGPDAGMEAGAEAALPTDEGPVRTRERVVISKNQSRGLKLALAGGVAVIVAGVSLQLTDYGAFGYHVILDGLHASEWATSASATMTTARKIIGADLYDQTRGAADTVANQTTALPRALVVAAAAALAEYEFQLRFGRDAARATRADAWLAGIQKATGKPDSIPFYRAAAAARLASQSDLPGARALLEAAAQKDAGDPVQQDIAFLRGEVELKAGDAAAATKAFTRALQVAPSARAHYGLARAAALTRDRAKVLSEVALTLSATPNHPGALVLRASFDWSEDRNDTAVVDGLKPLLNGPAKATAAPAELSRAFTLYGLAQAARGDVGVARTSFESALQLDRGNVDALLGQGEVFFADGRYGEALSRFDTAVQSDPNNPVAIVADAKAKISLERLADAKAQLAAAQKVMPKVMQVTYWLGRAEEAIGNKKGAEEAYIGAIAITNPKDREAIQPYVALSTLLAAQGRATEAQARLNEARAKLPDSGAMQRALGEIAAAQGLFDEAIAHYQAAAAKEPNDLKSQFLLGVTYLRMHRLDEASAQFDKVAAVDQDYPNLAMVRGQMLEQSGHVDQALDQFKAALNRAPKDLDLQLRVGAAYVGIGRGDEAYKTLKPVWDARQASAEVTHYLGRAHLLLGGSHLPEAERLLKKAADLEPTRAEYHLYVAWVEVELKNWKLAQTELEKTLVLDQLMGDGYWLRAVIEEVQASVEDAIKDATKALQLHPERTEAHATLARCYEDKNQPEKALAEWAIATTHGAEHPDWDFFYGRLLHEHNPPQALVHLLAAVKAGEAMNPTPVWLEQAEFMTAEGLLKSGNKTDAKEHFIRYNDMAGPSSPDRAEARRAIRAIDPEYHFK